MQGKALESRADIDTHTHTRDGALAGLGSHPTCRPRIDLRCSPTLVSLWFRPCSSDDPCPGCNVCPLDTRK